MRGGQKKLLWNEETMQVIICRSNQVQAHLDFDVAFNCLPINTHDFDRAVGVQVWSLIV